MPLPVPRHRPGRRALIAAMLASVLALAAADAWVWGRGRGGPDLAQAPTWIVVPGASVRRDGTPSPILRERLETALALATRWPSSRVLLSGTAVPRGYDEPAAMAAWLHRAGLSRERLSLDRFGRDTWSTMERLGPPHGSLAVASQPWHLPRAVWTARHLGWTAEGFPAGPVPAPGLHLREHAVRAWYFLRGLSPF